MTIIIDSADGRAPGRVDELTLERSSGIAQSCVAKKVLVSVGVMHGIT